MFDRGPCARTRHQGSPRRRWDNCSVGSARKSGCSGYGGGDRFGAQRAESTMRNPQGSPSWYDRNNQLHVYQQLMDGGGGGSRTRVRKHVVVGLYMRVRVCFLVPGVRTRPKPPDTSLGRSRSHAPRRRVATSLLDGVRPPTTRRGQGERHCLIKQRE